MRLLAFSLLILSLHIAQGQTLTILVHAPAGTPDTAKVYIAGNLPQLGSWRADGRSMAKGDSGIWSAAVQVQKGTEVEFKVTLGNWDQEALSAAGVIPGNTIVKVTRDTTVSLSPSGWKQPGHKSAGQITGNVRYHRAMAGRGLLYPRDVIVWLPPSYDSTTTRRYPVLYMQDGQNVFDPGTSFSGFDWRADEVADSLIRHGAMQEIIVVAIGNSPDRMQEFADTTSGRAYAAFVVSQLKPMVDSVYRTKPDRANTAVMGSSLGGLISFLFVWWHPDVFSKAACLSSSFFYQHGRVIRDVKSAKRLPSDITIYLDCGTGEKTLVPDYKQMHELLRKKGLIEGKTLMGFLEKGAVHNERAWAHRLWRPLEFLFSKTTR